METDFSFLYLSFAFVSVDFNFVSLRQRVPSVHDRDHPGIFSSPATTARKPNSGKSPKNPQIVLCRWKIYQKERSGKQVTFRTLVQLPKELLLFCSELGLQRIPKTPNQAAGRYSLHPHPPTPPHLLSVIWQKLRVYRLHFPLIYTVPLSRIFKGSIYSCMPHV